LIKLATLLMLAACLYGQPAENKLTLHVAETMELKDKYSAYLKAKEELREAEERVLQRHAEELKILKAIAPSLEPDFEGISWCCAVGEFDPNTVENYGPPQPLRDRNGCITTVEELERQERPEWLSERPWFDTSHMGPRDAVDLNPDGSLKAWEPMPAAYVGGSSSCRETGGKLECAGSGLTTIPAEMMKDAKPAKQ
jgi:hypothetical protein